jgi:hypothetical protein
MDLSAPLDTLAATASFGQTSLINSSGSSNHWWIGLIGIIGLGLIGSSAPSVSAASLARRLIGLIGFVGITGLIGLVGHISLIKLVELIGRVSLVGLVGLVGSIGISFISLVDIFMMPHRPHWLHHHMSLVGQISLVSISGPIGRNGLVGIIGIIELSALLNHWPIGLIGVIGLGLIASSASTASLASWPISFVSLVGSSTHNWLFRERLTAAVIKATKISRQLKQAAALGVATLQTSATYQNCSLNLLSFHRLVASRAFAREGEDVGGGSLSQGKRCGSGLRTLLANPTSVMCCNTQNNYYLSGFPQMIKYCVMRECDIIHSWISTTGDLSLRLIFSKPDI